MVEAAGIEPASEDMVHSSIYILSPVFLSPLKSPQGWILEELAYD